MRSPAVAVAVLLLAAGCDKGERTGSVRVEQVTLDPDPCAIVTQADAAAFFGEPAIQKPSAPGECVWGCDCDFPDGASWRLHARVEPATKSIPTTFVSTSEITYKGHRVSENFIAQLLPLDDTAVVTLELRSTGPSAPDVTTKQADLKLLAEMLLARSARSAR